MMPIESLNELLGRVGAFRDNPILVSADELQRWPSEAIKAMKSQKLIVKTRPASTALCPGCEQNCVMPVHTLSNAAGKSSSFIVCDKRNDINRVSVPAEILAQWQCSTDLVSGFIVTSLGLRSPTKRTDQAGRCEIGMVSGDKRSQMLCLEVNGALNLIVGTSTVPLAEFIEFHDGVYSLDIVQIQRLVDAATTADNRYTPSNARREVRKLDTQAMYESWRKEYRALKREKPGMPDAWYSKKIAKMEIAKGRDAETIRKRMKQKK